MRAPGFWSDPPGTRRLRTRLMSPLGAIYAAATARRVARPPRLVTGVPVISVGNLHAGGTGKTPTAIALLDRLGLAGLTPHVITRGFGGRIAGPLRVEPRRHSARDVGDEPLLLAAFAPVWVARDRAAGAAAAIGAGADALVLDDAHQNPDVAKTAALVCIPAPEGFGNGRVLPAGPLREPVAAGLARADLAVVIGPATARPGVTATLPAALARLEAELRPLATGLDWTGRRVFAVAGIARPTRFFDTLRALGADLAGGVALDDHQPIGPALLARLEAEAGEKGAQLVVTEKDAVRLPPDARTRILTLPVRLEIVDWAPFDHLLAARA